MIIKRVIKVDEDNEGFIGLVVSEDLIVDFLIKDGWLRDNTEIYTNNGWIEIKSIFGSNWKNKIKTLSIEGLSLLFENVFYFTYENIYYGEDK